MEHAEVVLLGVAFEHREHPRHVPRIVDALELLAQGLGVGDLILERGDGCETLVDRHARTLTTPGPPIKRGRLPPPSHRASILRMPQLASRPALSLACSLTLIACGARSELLPTDGSGGAGAGSTSSATTSSTTGVGGGVPVPRCDALVADASISPPPTGTDAQSEHEPGLVRIDAGRVMLFAGVVDSLAAAETLVATTFEPWGAWPEELGASDPIAWALRDGSIEASNGDGTASLLLPLYSLGREGATTAFLAPRIEPSTAYTDPPGEFLFEIAGAGRPAYLRRTSAGYSIGWVSAFGGFSYLGQLRTDAAGNPAGVDYESGCASTRVRADALQIGDQVLRAYSSGRDFGTCSNDDGIPGPGLRLQTDIVGPDDFVVQGDERILEEPIAFVALLPRGADGAWLVYRTDGSTSFAPPPLVAVPLDSGGRIVGEQVALFESSFSAPPVAVAPFGAGFAAAWIEMGETSSVAVRIFGADGQPLAAGGFNAEPIDSGDRLSLLASDDADALLVGWTHFGDRVHVTRLRCVDGR